ncbi:MAG: hypothetical protein PHH58_07415 [Rhodoferax sp.]|nr:hypothetical protein [Rhodoferax sp.]
MVQTITIYSQAPPKPVLGAPCNGCGVCCLLNPCPLGVVLSGRRQGACAALRWQPAQAHYRCGAITQPTQVLGQRLPSWTSPAVPSLAWLLRRAAPRWLAAGVGCDCDADVSTPLIIEQ